MLMAIQTIQASLNHSNRAAHPFNFYLHYLEMEEEKGFRVSTFPWLQAKMLFNYLYLGEKQTSSAHPDNG